nr:hypothetical protein [Tanacetum cinerariifolium]
MSNVQNEGSIYKFLICYGIIDELDYACKAVYANDEAVIDNTSSKETNELHKVSFISNDDVQVAQEEDDVSSRVLPCQLPPKELNP